MNDFTKEELRQIHEILVDVCRQWKEPDSTYELRDKIQSMIDNYIDKPPCLHKKIVTGAYSRSNPPMKCESCGALYYE